MLTKDMKEYLIVQQQNMIDEHKKGIRWHEDAIKNCERRIKELS